MTDADYGLLIGVLFVASIFGFITVGSNLSDNACTLYKSKGIEIRLSEAEQKRLKADDNMFIFPNGMKLPVNETAVLNRVDCK